MKRLLALALSACLLFAFGAQAETLTGTAKGFGDAGVTVTVTVEGGKITKVEAVGPSETQGIGTPALEQLPALIVAAGNTQVDVIAGATYTSKAILKAVEIAMGLQPAEVAATEAPVVPVEIAAADAYIGFGMLASGRLGPGKDDKDVPVYSVNEVYANVIFDKDGKILFAYLDQLEYATPNYDGEGMPHFSGFPGQGGYNYDENHDAKVDSVIAVDDASFQAQIASWLTKRQRGGEYMMNTGTWTDQANKFAQIFVGKTVAEIEEWFAKYTSDRNGRPLKDGSTNEADAAKYKALSDEDKAILADVTTAATMSLNDGHGNILGALKKAYENRQPLTADAAAFGFGLNNSGRIGPGKDDKDVSVYSINQVYATSLFDAEGRLTYLHLDQLEVATPNYDGASMPHFSGFPSQIPYNYDENHDAKVDTTLTATDDSFMAEINGWLTKRERGADYMMGTGTWSDQANKYQELFLGKTVGEIEEWFAKYTSDRNGRPLKDGSTNEADAAKYAALSAEDKAILADVTTAATMSTKDGHGDILAAIRASFENKLPLALKLSK
jgi:major membrane immunogen (membrane-anchored lipoprotein)